MVLLTVTTILTGTTGSTTRNITGIVAQNNQLYSWYPNADSGPKTAMGNAPSDEEAAVGLAPGTPNSQIRSTGELASTDGQTRGNEILTTLSSGDTGESWKARVLYKI